MALDVSARLRIFVLVEPSCCWSATRKFPVVTSMSRGHSAICHLWTQMVAVTTLAAPSASSSSYYFLPRYSVPEDLEITNKEKKNYNGCNGLAGSERTLK